MNTSKSWALITGASSGLGAVFAEKLAEKGTNLILVARSADRLQSLRDALVQRFSIKVEIIIQDLSQVYAAEYLYNTVNQMGHRVTILVNNAGIGDYGLFHEISATKTLELLHLNIVTLSALTHFFLNHMKERKQGEIYNVASTIAFQPIPYMACYAASKAYVLSFSQAIAAEYDEFGISSLAVCPGGTATEFFSRMNRKPNFSLISPQQVVDEAIAAMSKHKEIMISSSVGDKILIQLLRFIPRSIALKVCKKIMKTTFS